ncbi:MAG: HAD-IIIC family phosphatase [Planctomycetota bacterium]
MGEREHLTNTASELRKAIEHAVSASRHTDAVRLLRQLWDVDPSAPTAAFLNRHYSALASEIEAKPYAVRILRSCTLEPMIPMLSATLRTHGLAPSVELGRFNAYAQDIIEPDSEVLAGEPDMVVLAVHARDLLPGLWSRFADLDADRVAALVDRTARDYEQWIDAVRARTPGVIVVHGFELPDAPSLGFLDAQTPGGQRETIASINAELRRLCHGRNDVVYLDYDALVARHGRARAFDARKWATVRLPVRAEVVPDMAREWARVAIAHSGKQLKCLVCDLDNTLWGGVIGEDGMDGIRLDGDHPGVAHQELQRVALDLYERGVILAICSKNNEADAMEAIGGHPGMVLKPDHFAASRINWQDKASNLREIAAELNIGIDSLAFIDDNPVERAWVREHCPEVTVIEIGEDPYTYAAALRDVLGFERIVLSSEDRSRSRFYVENRKRETLAQTAMDKGEFLGSLEMFAEIGDLASDRARLARCAQLTQKTNQFNLSTRRYTEEQVAQLAERDDAQVLWMRLGDRFGDNGVIAMAIVRYPTDRPDLAEIDTLLMSCRVIGRSVETGFLAAIAAAARERGRDRLEADFVPTKKNAPSKDFLPDHAFEQVGDLPEAGVRWGLPLDAAPGWPEFIRLDTPFATLAT